MFVVKNNIEFEIKYKGKRQKYCTGERMSILELN